MNVRLPWRPELGVYFVPIRHHSPACAQHLARMLDELRPTQILIEAPADFEHLLPVLDHAATRPPVAIVAFRRTPGSADAAQMVSYYPFCAHSPEFVALKYARANGAAVRFIDLAMAHRAMWSSPDDDPPAPEIETLPEVLTEERAFDSSDYVDALCARYGCRDQNELWDHLFETRVDGVDWRAFFTDTGAYCAHVRESSTQSKAERRANEARETAMRAGLAAARAAGPGPVVVVTGGFHTPALLDALSGEQDALAGERNALAGEQDAPGPDVTRRPKSAASETATPTASAYVIRYGFEALDRLNGYAAGLPSPGYYDRLWRAVQAGASGPALWNDLAAEVLVDFAAWLREFRPGLAVSLPTMSGALQNAVALAQLRDRPGPGRDDLLDACRSTFVKGEQSADNDPLLAEFVHFLGGSAFGEIPLSAGSPPLVEAVRVAAKRFELRIDDGERRRRELDIHRNPKHRALSRFFHATSLIDSHFANRTAGPDPSVGMKREILFEQWNYAWSPLVEARLIELAVAADTLETACHAEIRRLIAALDAEGRGRSASSLLPVLTQALQAGVRSAHLHDALARALADDADFASIVTALAGVDALWRARGALEVEDPEPLGRLVALAFTRALYLLPEIASVDEAHTTAHLEALASLRTIVEGSDDAAVAAEFRDLIAELVRADTPPTIEGALAAVAYLAGIVEASVLIERLRGTIGGAYADAAERVAYLRGILAISRELLWNLPELIDAADAILASLDEDEFIAMLPHLRLAFTALDPRETDRVAERLAERYGASAADVSGRVAYGLTVEEVQRNLQLARQLDRALEVDGLAAWLHPPAAAESLRSAT